MSNFFLLIIFLCFVPQVTAAAPDGIGPWADEVISSNQKNTKNGTPVSTTTPSRSDATAALGAAEGTTTNGDFFSLGFGGSITLKFDNPFAQGLTLVEATNGVYPDEIVEVEVSADGTTWVSAGQVTQDGSVAQPQQIACATYVRITDISDSNLFTSPFADAYDLDGVRAIGEGTCELITLQPEPSPTPTPTMTPSPSPSSSNTSPESNSSETNSIQNASNHDSNNNSCSATKPVSSNLIATRTSGSTVALSWTAVPDTTHYTIAYGTSSGNYLYGVPNTGNTTTFTVGGLDPNTTYYFVVRAVNDCAPGDDSNEVSSSLSAGQVLGLSTDGIGSTGGRNQVLGLSTENLASTGTFFEIIRLLLSLASGLASFTLGRKLTSSEF